MDSARHLSAKGGITDSTITDLRGDPASVSFKSLLSHSNVWSGSGFRMTSLRSSISSLGNNVWNTGLKGPPSVLTNYKEAICTHMQSGKAEGGVGE